MKGHTPKITVLMPVYNGEQYLREAIESILRQTFTDFEFLIIDDGSTDGSAKIVRSYDDGRIRFEQNERNLGIVATLNRGLDLARGEFVARMDADDISLPKRLDRQVDFLEKHPDIGIVGTWLRTFAEANVTWKASTDHDAIRCHLLFYSDIYHATVMIRKKMFDENALRYDPAFLHCEDYELWMRALDTVKASNIPEVLYLYRRYPQQTCRMDNQDQRENAGIARKNYINRLAGSATDFELSSHEQVLFGKTNVSREQIKYIEMWFVKLLRLNKAKKVFSQDKLNRLLGQKFFSICTANTKLGFWLWLRYKRSLLAKNDNIPFPLRAKFFCKSLIKFRR